MKMIKIRCMLAFSLLTISIASTIFTAQSFGMQRQPPRQRPPANAIIDTLGLWQPESVRGILLIYSGKSIAKPKADELEVGLSKKPDTVDSRLLLIGYYTVNAKTPADRLRLRNHILWMIENHPEHPATAEPSLRDLPDDPEGNAQILALWNKNLELKSDDLDVLKDAEKFFFSKDAAAAERLIYLLAQKEPNNREWPAELAQLYRMVGIPGEPIDDPAQRALESYKRVLALTRLPAAREALAGDMAQAAFKVGDFGGASELAKVYLQTTDRAAPQRGNTILGRVALRSGDLSGAKQYLLASSAPEAAKDISLSGPTMILAKELLERGENDAVLQYLQNCMSLWPRGEDVLNIWMTDIKKGKMPNFGNLAF
jgi:hypothetical protein